MRVSLFSDGALSINGSLCGYGTLRLRGSSEDFGALPHNGSLKSRGALSPCGSLCRHGTFSLSLAAVGNLAQLGSLLGPVTLLTHGSLYKIGTLIQPGSNLRGPPWGVNNVPVPKDSDCIRRGRHFPELSLIRYPMPMRQEQLDRVSLRAEHDARIGKLALDIRLICVRRFAVINRG